MYVLLFPCFSQRQRRYHLTRPHRQERQSNFATGAPGRRNTNTNTNTHTHKHTQTHTHIHAQSYTHTENTETRKEEAEDNDEEDCCHRNDCGAYRRRGGSSSSQLIPIAAQRTHGYRDTIKQPTQPHTLPSGSRNTHKIHETTVLTTQSRAARITSRFFSALPSTPYRFYVTVFYFRFFRLALFGTTTFDGQTGEAFRLCGAQTSQQVEQNISRCGLCLLLFPGSRKQTTTTTAP